MDETDVIFWLLSETENTTRAYIDTGISNIGKRL